MKHNIVVFFIFLLPLGAYTQEQTLGLFLQTPESYQGYTLFAPSTATSTYLIDNCGYLANEWVSSFRPGLSAYLLEDGSLLRAARIPSNFNGGGSGGRIERFSWDGDLIWGYDVSTATYHQHHDIEYMPNGNILAVCWERITTQEARDAGRENVSNNGFWTTLILELRPIGADQAEIVWQWRLFDHLIQDVDSLKNNFGMVADHPERINVNIDPSNSADWVHVNSVDYNADLDQILLSAHDVSEVWVIDHSTTTSEAAGSTGGRYGKGGDILYRWGNPQNYDRGGPFDKRLFGQHDAAWVESGLPWAGAISVFNNGVSRTGGFIYSTVDIWYPPVDSAGVYSIAENQAFGPDSSFITIGEADVEFYSSRISGAQVLPNGNVLICVGRDGQFLEVDSLGVLVWDYINPVNISPLTQGTAPFGIDVFRAYRYGLDYPAFEGRTIIADAPIELNPIDYDCELFTSTTHPEIHVNTAQMQLFPNPVNDELSVLSTTPERIYFEVFSSRGRLVTSGYFFQTLNLPVTSYAQGLYFFQTKTASGLTTTTQQFIVN